MPETQLEKVYEETKIDSKVKKELVAKEKNHFFLKLLPYLYLTDITTGTFLLLIIDFSSGVGEAGPYWMSILVASTALRAAFQYFKLDPSNSPLNPVTTRIFLVSGSLIAGVVWGTAWLLLPSDPDFFHIVLVGFWLGGLQAGAAATMAVIKQVFFAYTIPANLIYIVFLSTAETEYQTVTIAAYLMYLGFIIPIAMRVGMEFNQTIKLKIENQCLQNELHRDERALSRKEEELSIQKRKSAALESEKNSARKKLALAAEERVLLMDSIEEGIFGLNRFGEFTFINSTARELLDFNESDVIGKSAISVLNSTLKRSEKEMKTNLQIGNCYLGNKTLKKLDSIFCGSGDIKLPVRFSCRPVKKENIVIGAVVSFSNMSEQKEMEAMLVQSQKMEAIGRLTGGVSHDFNNLLTIIMGNIQFLLKKIPKNKESIELLNRIMAAAKSGAELNHRLLSFSREQALKKSNVDANDVISEMSDFLVRVLGEDIILKLELCEDDCTIDIDKTQFENALLNLCVNARDAMPQGGELTITTEFEPNDIQPYNTDLVNPAEGTVLISVKDTGIGISPENIKQIFEPFFTTKKKDRGTGLGLSTAYGFIKQSGGNISVESKQWEWTKFKIFLPKAPLAVDEAIPDEEPSEPMDHISGVVLVVEDDDHVRQVACEMLKDFGFEVVTAKNGVSGLSAFKSNPEIELIFSDIVMPGGMNGIQLTQEVLAVAPNTPVILVTGYADKETKREIPNAPNIACIAKPYDIDKVPHLVNRMIAEAKSYE